MYCSLALPSPRSRRVRWVQPPRGLETRSHASLISELRSSRPMSDTGTPDRVLGRGCICRRAVLRNIPSRSMARGDWEKYGREKGKINLIAWRDFIPLCCSCSWHTRTIYQHFSTVVYSLSFSYTFTFGFVWIGALLFTPKHDTLSTYPHKTYIQNDQRCQW